MRNHLFLYVLVMALVLPIFSPAAKTASTREASLIEKCLSISTNLPQDCIKRNLKNKTLNACYALSETIYSDHSKENVRNYCFYNISEFPSLNACTAAAKKFFIAENKDQALFECFRQFSSQMDRRTCFSIAKMMSYHEKRKYLETHCHFNF